MRFESPEVCYMAVQEGILYNIWLGDVVSRIAAVDVFIYGFFGSSVMQKQTVCTLTMA